MVIRKIKKYTVVKRFTLGQQMCDKKEIIYIEEPNPDTNDVQKVFGKDKRYITDISRDMFLALKEGFITRVKDAA